MLWLILAVLVSLTEATGFENFIQGNLLNHFRQSSELTPSGKEGEKIRAEEAYFDFDEIRNNPDFKLIVQRIDAIESFVSTGEMKDYTFDTFTPIDRLEVTLSGHLDHDEDSRVTVHFLTVKDGTKLEDHRGLKAFIKLQSNKDLHLATIKSMNCIEVKGQPQLCPVVMTAGIPATDMNGAFEGSANPKNLKDSDKTANSKILVDYLTEVTEAFAKINSLKFYYGDIRPSLLMWNENEDRDKIVPVIGYSNLIVEIIEEPKTPNKLAPLPFMLYAPEYRPFELSNLNTGAAFPSENHLGLDKYSRNADYKEESYALGKTLKEVIESHSSFLSLANKVLSNLKKKTDDLLLGQVISSTAKPSPVRPSIKEFAEAIRTKDLKKVRI